MLEISPEEHRSRILGIKSMVGSSGTILGSALIALFNSSMDVRSIFLMSVGIVLLTTIIGSTLPGRERSSRKELGPDTGTGEISPSQYLKDGTRISSS
jgi:MFS family permease